MKESRNGFIRNLRYLCLISVIVFGLITILGSGGGGGGDTSADGDETPTDGDETSLPKIAGFNFDIIEGDFWEYEWDDYHSSYAQGSGGSSSTVYGAFRITLGSPKEIEGITAYEVNISGKTRSEFKPRWEYIAVDNNKILGSQSGTTLETIFDAQEGAWTKGGFFVTFPSYLITASDGSINNDYISETCIKVGQSASEDQCEYFPGIGNICGDSSYNWQEYEYYMEEIGPIGYYYYNSYSDCGGGFCSGATWRRNVGLVACSLSGDTIDHEFEVEPNNSPSTAQPIVLSMDYEGYASQWDEEGTKVTLNETQESEANDSPTEAQSLTMPTFVTGAVSATDNSDYNFQYSPYGSLVDVDAEDWYAFTQNSSYQTKIHLNFEGSSTADIDLFLFDSTASTLIAYSIKDNPNPNVDDATESIERYLTSGNSYILAVDAYDTPDGSCDYSLDLYAGSKANEQNIEDWYSFKLTARTSVTISLLINDPDDGDDADLYLFNASATSMLGYSNQSSGDLEDITITLDPGTYIVGVDAYKYSMNYTLTIQ